MAKNQNLVSRNIGYFIAIIGLVLSSLSIDYSNTISALVGVTLVLWGGILVYIRADKYVKTDIIQNIVKDSYVLFEDLFGESSILSRPVYMPEPSLSGIDQVRVKMEAKDGSVNVVPPGYSLHKMVENELGLNFSSTSFDDKKTSIIKTLTVDYELASNIDITGEESNNKYLIKIKNNVFVPSINLENKLLDNIGDPLTSALMCIMTRTLNKNLVIEKTGVEGKITEVNISVQ